MNENTTLSETEREDLIEAIQNGDEVAWVENLLTARLDTGLRIEIDSHTGRPTTCRVWYHDTLRFDGVSRDAITHT